MASGKRSRSSARGKRASSSGKGRSGGSGSNRNRSGGSGQSGHSGQSAAQRRRKKEREARKRRIVLIAAVAAIALGIILAVRAVLTGTSSTDFTSSTAEFFRDGSIRITSIESFDQEYYDEEELREAISQALEAYGKGVSRDSLNISDTEARLVLTYESAEDYVAFNDMDLFIGTVSEAQEAGYDFQSIMSAVSQEDTSKILNQATLDQLPDNEVIILCEEVDVVTWKGILYATPNLGVTDKTHASVVDSIDEDTPAIIILMDE